MAGDADFGEYVAARCRTPALSAVGVAAAAVAVGGTMLLAGGPNFTNPAPPVALTRPVSASGRLVGIGHVAIAIPEQWGTNQPNCGNAAEDAVIIDAGPQDPCAISRPNGVESVMVRSGKPIDFETLLPNGQTGEQGQKESGSFDARVRPHPCARAVLF